MTPPSGVTGELHEANEGWEGLARSAAGRVAGRDAAAPVELRELLVIWLDGDPYALPIERVREIVRLRPITPVPRVPDAVRGVISLRGEIGRTHARGSLRYAGVPQVHLYERR